MKRLKRLISLVALFVASCGAVQPAYAMTNPDNVKFCIGVGEIAAGIMTIRQISDKGLGHYLTYFADDEIAFLLLVSAYEHPQYPDEELQQKVIMEFKDRNILLCLSVV